MEQERFSSLDKIIKMGCNVKSLCKFDKRTEVDTFVTKYNKKTKKYLLLDSNYLPKRATSAFGDWIKVDRLLSGALESQYFYFFKLSEK